MSRLKTGILTLVFAGICSFTLSAQRLVPCGKAYCDSATEKIILPPKYDETFPFRNGYAVVRMGKKYKAIDTTGQFVTKKGYQQLHITEIPGLFLAQASNNKYGLIRPGDQIVLPLEYTWIAEWDEDHFTAIGPATLLDLPQRVRGKYKATLARPDGSFLIAPTEDSVFIVSTPQESTHPPKALSEARYALIRNEKWFIFDGNGKLIGEVPYFKDFWGMNILTWDGQKIGFRRASDLSEISTPENLKENYRTISMNKKWGVMNSAGELVVPAEYENIHYSFSRATESPATPVIVNKAGKWGVIDLKNNQLIAFKYEDISPIRNYDPFGNPYFAVKKDGKWGVADIKGNLIGAIQYDEIGEGTSGGKEFRVRLKKKWGVMSSTGELKWEE